MGCGLGLTNHQGNANQNHNEISSHTHQDGFYQKKQKTTNVGMDVENTCKLLVGMQNGAAALENNMEVPQKIKNRTTI